MLPKNRRIPRKEFQLILNKGKRYNSPIFLLYKAENNTNNQTKIAFSVSKKVSKTAVSRNKYRRQGYSVVRKYINQIKPGYFLFFNFKKPEKKIEYKTIGSEIEKLLSDSGMLL